MKNDNNDQQLIEKLKQLPKIEDRKNKDELFQRISSRMNEQNSQKKNNLIPVFGSLSVIILMLAIIPALLQIDIPEKSLDNSAYDDYIVSESSDHDEGQMNHSDLSERESAEEQEIRMMATEVESYVLSADHGDSTIVYGAVTDDQLQTVIPISIVHPKAVDLNAAYNDIDDNIDTTDWGVAEYLFEHVDFKIDLTNHEVFMNIPHEFSLGEGSAHAYMFQEVLTTMFAPYHIENVVFDKNIALGSIGNISELPIIEQGKTIYRIFQANDQSRKFLVPIQIGDDVTIEEAFSTMKNDQSSFNIYPTLPNDIQFSFLSIDGELVISIDHHQIFEQEQDATMMIESMLMTAKSFGYESVRFEHILKEQIGPYQLTESIKVPVSINPIYQ